jgi:transposase-like protein
MLETDPTQLPRAEKERIAREAKRAGAWATSKKYGIESRLIAAWIGCYLREGK